MWNQPIQRSFSSIALDAITETISLGVNLVFAPLAACYRSLQWFAARARMNEYEFIHLRVRRDMRQGATTSLEFLRTYMREHERLVRSYRQAQYRSLHEAQVGLVLFRMAEADLLARAQKAALSINAENTNE
jgi:hypothetical protein